MGIVRNPAAAGYGARSSGEHRTDLFFQRVSQQAGININTNAGVWAYVVSGNTLYAAADTDGIYVFDISDPYNPVQKTTVRFRDTSGTIVATPVTDVLVVGTTLLACGRSINFTIDNVPGLVATYDLANPEVPVWQDTYQPADMDPKPMHGALYYNNWYQGMATDGTYVYLACQAFGLTVLDISTPTAIAVHGTYDNVALAAAVAGGFGDAGMYWECSRIVYQSGWVYLANHGNGVVALDVSTPATPTNPQWFDAPIQDGVQMRTRDLDLYGNYLCAAPNASPNNSQPQRGLCVIDITDPTAVDVSDWVVVSINAADNDTWIGAGDMPILGVSVHDHYAFLANGQHGTAVYDITTPTSPKYLGLQGEGMLAGTNLYMTHVMKHNGKKVAYYSDAKEPSGEENHVLYVDKVVNL